MLAKLDNIRAALAKVASIDDAKEIRDKAEAIRVYSRQQQCRDIERDASIIRLRAERRLGQLLAKTVRRGNPKLTRGEFSIPGGISQNQSAKWQLAAKLPERRFEKYIESRNPTTKGVVKLAIEHRRKRQAAKGPEAGGNILTGDMWQLHSRLEDASVDLFLTDPPCTDLECYSQLGELAAAKLKPGGLCLAYSGTFRLPEVMRRMGEHLDYFWTFAISCSSSHVAIHPRRIQSSWKPVVAFSRGKPNNGWVTDRIRGGGRSKGHHEWEQSLIEAEYLIEKLSPLGGLVVDPYVGSGTVLMAAKKLGRRYVGCEIDANVARGARRRLAA